MQEMNKISNVRDSYNGILMEEHMRENDTTVGWHSEEVVHNNDYR